MRSPIIRVLAPNPGPFTLEGTNTWIVGVNHTFVIDPGPDDEGHLDAVRREAGSIEAILLTHRHPDHAPGAPRLASMSGAPVLAFRPEEGEHRLRDGEVLEAGGMTLRVVHAPGHTQDHVVFHDPFSGSLFTGDAVLGRGTSIVDPPDGDMSAYMRTLSAMLSLSPRVIYPGHGPVVWSAVAKLEEYVQHRKEREEQVLGGLRDGNETPEALVQAIYSDYPPDLYPAATRSVLAHLLKLEREGRVERAGSPREARFRVSTPHACSRCGRPARQGSSLCPQCSLEILQERPSSAT
ncbi:MAG TPA: MBL fold metallo-hydrolase [Actinomycetota bacterium]|jgi:glyoxylase-like metal-dependent hydrolase (beta-lactamase superfamily II)